LNGQKVISIGENIAMTNFAFPQNAVLELTYRCNQKCKFCSCPWENTEKPSLYYERREELSIEEWKKALKLLERSGVINVTISGGEALLKEGMDELLFYIRKNTGLNQDMKIIIISNAAVMNEDYVRLFKEVNAHLSLSLPGLATFSYHVGTSFNSPDNVLHWLQRASEEKIETTVNVTVTQKNYHELYETVANGLIAGAGTVLINRFLVGGRGLTYQAELSLSKDELRGLLNIIEKVLTISKRFGSVGTEYPLCLIPKGDKQNKMLRIGSRCAAANGFFVVDPSGYIRTCNHSPKRVGHVFNEPIISDDDYWNIFAHRTFELPEMCKSCKFKNDCDYGCREAAAICHGSLSAPDPCFVG